jgi:hypothetical protein
MDARVSIVSLAWAAYGAVGGNIAYADDTIFAEDFDGPKWCIDADADGYGNRAVLVHAATQPPGYVANALDCNDADPAIHPGVPDDPDAAFVDNNCDGIDGDIAKAIFVATSGSDGPTCGTLASPCHSPAYAITRLNVQHTQIYVQVGTYTGAFGINASTAFYGGYDTTWQRGAVTAGGPNAKFAGSIAAMGTHGAQAFAVYVPGGVQAILADIEVDAPNTTVTSNGNGLNSYALYADQGANVQLLRDKIVAANGAGGADGSAGVDAVQNAIPAATAGDPGQEYSVFCDNTSRGHGGAASTNTCASGRSVVAGAGGDGGTMDTDCSAFSLDLTATPGSTGINAETIVGTAGNGGTGGSGGTSCGPTQGGFAGAVSNGSGGPAGIGSALVDGQWSADAGANGTVGDNGGGGGGGGGAGGCDIGTDSYGAGGGGGGAGGCAAVSPGSGGGGGGGSFGVFAYSATVTVQNSVIDLGHGGAGGKGGVAGVGQTGGAGGLGGAGAGGATGGNGGAGGRGGVAGGGGGGQGGIAFGIYSYSSTVSSSGNTFVGGVAGSGGSGGTSGVGAGAGQDGQAGTTGNVGTCAALSNC